MIIFLTGPSGVGKSTLRDFYCRTRDLVALPAMTTRKTRSGENEIHQTVSVAEFQNLRDDNKLCLVARNHGFWYGYHKDIIEGIGDNLAIIEVDSNTAIKEKNNLNATIIRVIPTNPNRTIEIIRDKRDDVDDRLADFRKQMEPSFLSSRRIAGDTMFENDNTSTALERFCVTVNAMVQRDTGVWS